MSNYSERNFWKQLANFAVFSFFLSSCSGDHNPAQSYNPIASSQRSSESEIKSLLQYRAGKIIARSQNMANNTSPTGAWLRRVDDFTLPSYNYLGSPAVDTLRIGPNLSSTPGEFEFEFVRSVGADYSKDHLLIRIPALMLVYSGKFYMYYSTVQETWKLDVVIDGYAIWDAETDKNNPEYWTRGVDPDDNWEGRIVWDCDIRIRPNFLTIGIQDYYMMPEEIAPHPSFYYRIDLE